MKFIFDSINFELFYENYFFIQEFFEINFEKHFLTQEICVFFLKIIFTFLKKKNNIFY